LLVLQDLLEAYNKFLLEKLKTINAKMFSQDSDDNNCKESDCKESDCKESDCKESDCKESDCKESDCKESDCKESDCKEDNCKETIITYTNEIEEKLQDNKT